MPKNSLKVTVEAVNLVACLVGIVDYINARIVKHEIILVEGVKIRVLGIGSVDTDTAEVSTKLITLKVLVAEVGNLDLRVLSGCGCGICIDIIHIEGLSKNRYRSAYVGL